jgi:hypothetical protein
MINNKLLGVGFGIIAGIIDVLPMTIQKLTWDANISAFSMWIIVGLIISSIDFKMPSMVKGILISFMILLPSAILIAWKEPLSMIPISIMTLLLGSGLGYFIDKFKTKPAKPEMGY